MDEKKKISSKLEFDLGIPIADLEKFWLTARQITIGPKSSYNAFNVLRARYDKHGNQCSTFAAIGEILGFSPQRAGALHAQALRRMRHPAQVAQYTEEEEESDPVKVSCESCKHYGNSVTPYNVCFKHRSVITVLHVCEQYAEANAAQEEDHDY